MTNARLTIFGLFAAAATLLVAAPARAAEDNAPLVLAQGADCYAIGQRVAAQMGGQLAAANAERTDRVPDRRTDPGREWRATTPRGSGGARPMSQPFM